MLTRRILPWACALIALGCGDEGGSGADGSALDGSRMDAADGQSAMDAVAGEARDGQGPEGQARDAVDEAPGGATDGGMDRPPDVSRGMSNSWWALASGSITTIQPVGGVLDSHVVVAGGRTGPADTGVAITSYFQLPDAATTAITVQTGNPLVTARWGAAHAVVAGRLWAVGGSSATGVNCLRSTESLESPTAMWTPGPNLPQGRCAASAVAQGQYLFVFGGSTRPVPNIAVTLAPAATCRLDTMNLAGGWDCTSFAAGNDVPTVQRFNAGAASGDAFAVIAGGRDMTNPLSVVDRFVHMAGNPDFTVGVAAPMALNQPAVAISGGQIYLLGGSPQAQADGDAIATMWRLPADGSGAWAPITAASGAPSARAGHLLLVGRCASCPTDKLYAVGGHHQGVVVPQVEEYTP